jgi:4-hydroxybenzoate polyprenyltransferase
MVIILYSLVALAISISLIIYTEKDNPYLFLPTLILVGINYFFFKDMNNYIQYFSFKTIGAYFFIGFVNSLIMTFVMSKKLSDYSKENFNLKTAVFNWIFFWPITLIYHLIGDFVRILYNQIFDKISFIYLGIFNHGKKDGNK